MAAGLLVDGHTHQIGDEGSFGVDGASPLMTIEGTHKRARQWRALAATETAIGTFIGTVMPGIRMRRMLAQSLCLIVAFGAGGACHAGAKACSAKDAEAADAAIDSLDSWAKIRRAYRMYGHCDDGSIAEGNSEAVARLLVGHWNTLPVLADLVKRDPAFQDFVLRHIDTTLNTNDLDRIAALAGTQCPAGSAPLCRALERAAARAAKA